MSPTQLAATKADQHWTVVMTAIILIAAVLRMGAVHYANTHPDKFMWPDSQRYLQAAANVAAGNGPIVSPSNRTGADPGYPLLLSWPARAWPDDLDKVAAAARWINVVAGLATIIFAAYLGRLLFGSAAGLVAAAILAIQPIQVYFHALVLTEVIYTTLLVGSLYALARYMLEGGGAYLFGCAIGLGIATLIRSSGLFLPILMLPLVAWAGHWQSVERGEVDDSNRGRRRVRSTGFSRVFVWSTAFRRRSEVRLQPSLSGSQEKKPSEAHYPPEGGTPNGASPILPRTGQGGPRGAAAAVVTFCVCYACVLMPAAYRNYRILGAFVPVRTGVGESLLESVGPWADGGPGMQKIQRPDYPDGANEYVRDRMDRAAAISYIKQDIGRFMRLAGNKFLRTWNVRMNLSDYRSPMYDLLAMISTIPVFVLALLGWLRHRRQVSRWLLLLLPAIYFTLLHMVFVGSVRYRYPAMPTIMVLAGAALVAARKDERDGQELPPDAKPSRAKVPG